MTTKRFVPGKLLPVWIAISAVLIVAGIVMAAVLGYNYVAAERKSVEVIYDAVVAIEEKDAKIEEICEAAFASAGVEYVERQESAELDAGYISETGDTLLRYAFDGATDGAALKKAADEVRTKIAADEAFRNCDVYVSVHVQAGERFYESVWRGAIAFAVAAVVVLVYVGFRFGVAEALSGLCSCVNDVCLAVFLPALFRIPVYAYGPMLFGGIALFASIVALLVRSMRMREDFKDASFAGLSAEEKVARSVLSGTRFYLLFLVPLAAVIVLLGAVAGPEMRLAILPALIPLAASVYSSFLLAPAVLVPIKKKVDAYKNRHKRYAAKKKTADAEE